MGNDQKDGNGFDAADAARRLHESCNVDQILWDQFQSENSVSRSVTCCNPAEDGFLGIWLEEVPLPCLSSFQMISLQQGREYWLLLRQAR
ncbi:hypothetical protein AVEN_115021-1 [Araneus ventricosus]|uniref:Uncharacterized protein n=1 Tax=Araneus ventricosus TaxID=182803 RepID=A0A4Y1ZWW2_ARAVE|nr:hypothetical protein AVEN_115021-1 [Araneus ventricosus]